MLTRLRTVLAESGVSGTSRRLLARALTEIAEHLRRRSRLIAWPRDRQTLASATLRARLENNLRLRHRGRGRRCFVLASGPSTVAQDLTRLRGEAVIAVNEMFLRLERDKVEAAALMFLDRDYLNETPGYRRFMEDFAAAAERMGAMPVMPIAAEPVIAQRKLFTNCEPHYVAYVGQLLDDPMPKAPCALDFAAPLPGLYTVTHAALALALYMGFDEIILLGADMDYLAQPWAPIRHGYGDNPYNDFDRLSAIDAFQRGVGWDYPAMLDHAAEQLRAFRRLSEIAAAGGQVIYNAGPLGPVDAFQSRSFDALFP